MSLLKDLESVLLELKSMSNQTLQLFQQVQAPMLYEQNPPDSASFLMDGYELGLLECHQLLFLSLPELMLQRNAYILLLYLYQQRTLVLQIYLFSNLSQILEAVLNKKQ